MTNKSIPNSNHVSCHFFHDYSVVCPFLLTVFLSDSLNFIFPLKQEPMTLTALHQFHQIQNITRYNPDLFGSLTSANFLSKKKACEQNVMKTSHAYTLLNSSSMGEPAYSDCVSKNPCGEGLKNSYAMFRK